MKKTGIVIGLISIGILVITLGTILLFYKTKVRRVVPNSTVPYFLRDGLTWENAYTNIQTAIDELAAAGGGEVWVKGGSYSINDDSKYTDKSIFLKENVKVYGGFAGDEGFRSARDWETNITVLDGKDKSKSGVAHVVSCVGGVTNAEFNGFTITGGDAYTHGSSCGSGGVMDPNTIYGCCINASRSGGGVLICGSSPVIKNCSIVSNRAMKGGGVYVMVAKSPTGEPPYVAGDAPLFYNCVFYRNNAEVRGGGVAHDLFTSPVYEKCQFLGNNCDGKGGAVYNDFDCDPYFINCLFAYNTAVRGSGIASDGSSNPTIINSTITKNHAKDIGAGLYVGSYNILLSSPIPNIPIVVNSIIWDNDSDWGGPSDISMWHESYYDINHSLFSNDIKNFYTNNLVDEDPLFASTSSNPFALRKDSPCIDAGTLKWTGVDIPTEDILGETRIDDPDIGAYEYVGK